MSFNITSLAKGKWIRANHLEEPGYDQELVDWSEKLVDLVIVMDNTSSMSGEIKIAKDTVQSIITTLHDHFQSDLRFSAVSYRDHTDDYVVKEYPFTKNVEKAKGYVNEMFAKGGGDMPEALASALKVVNEIPFNKKGRKICIWIADAPPHGMGASGDYFPDGCKDEQGEIIDWIKLASHLQEKNVVFYSIICGRSKNDQQLSLFMDYLATKTDGKCMLLTEANKIPNLIINGCIEDEQMDRLVEERIKELGKENAKAMKEEELIAHVHKLTLEAKVPQVHNYKVSSSRTGALLACSSMSSVDRNWYSTATNAFQAEGASDNPFSVGSVSVAPPTTDQLKKACARNLRK
ncbi:vWFA domain-containing protein [Naegleria gruberi]|uniref:VWFA domain-containing protein n=1 Tax=Naegleria gruberi TaxID=5762 RepID=D2VZQ0_NAEGR|nr:vWFA domain-containing protein [Naegleria gruberi]EFC37699.1 vWFA domain-containing protein [Naegleria gruberi]|eukprot:XP_002670443.1 vWFA domain-containing protein [Naegleria gruberi strain NEG-M]